MEQPCSISSKLSQRCFLFKVRWSHLAILRVHRFRLTWMAIHPVSKQNHDKVFKKATSSFRNRWWFWGGLSASVALMLLANLLLVRESFHSLELAKAKVKADSLVKNDLQAAMVNIIIVHDDADINENNTFIHEDAAPTTSSTVESELTIQSTNTTVHLDDSLASTDIMEENNLLTTLNSAEENDSTELVPPTNVTNEAGATIPTMNATEQTSNPFSIVSAMELGGNAVTATNCTSLSGFSVVLTASSATATNEFDVPTDTDDVQLQSDVVDEDKHEEDSMLKRVTLPQRWPPEEGSQDECLYLRDYGLLERLGSLSTSFCNTGLSSSPYTFYHVPSAEFSAAKLMNFVLDMRGAQVSQDIYSLEQDGGGHDPRFKYKPNSVFCSCTHPQDAEHESPDVWMNLLADGPSQSDPVCQPLPPEIPDDALTLEHAVIVTRKDDHNPFFQISGILNAWIMMKVLGWESTSTQLVTLDRALPSPVDELRQAMLAPKRPVVSGVELQRRVVHFDSALLAPIETRGTMMSHLDDDQPCFANAMVTDFRDQALQSMSVDSHKADPRRCLVTVISRRPYGGRRVQRVWRNEEEVLSRTREDYKNAYRFGQCEFQSLDFVDMSMHDQMRIMVDSDVVIGMHGAGMVNVMWTRAGTLVVEIFPRLRRRWGYRNLCQFLGCSWHEFREGQDLFVRTTDPNDMDKYVSYDEWKDFFDPLFRSAIAKLEQEIEGL